MLKIKNLQILSSIVNVNHMIGQRFHLSYLIFLCSICFETFIFFKLFDDNCTDIMLKYFKIVFLI